MVKISDDLLLLEIQRLWRRVNLVLGLPEINRGKISFVNSVFSLDGDEDIKTIKYFGIKDEGTSPILIYWNAIKKFSFVTGLMNSQRLGEIIDDCIESLPLARGMNGKI